MTRTVGVQSFTYREFSNEEIQSVLVDTDVEAIELCDVHVDLTNKDQAERVRTQYEDAGIDVCGYGVHDFDDVDAVEPVLATAAEHLGAAYVSVHVDPECRSVIERLCEVAAAYDLRLGVHNHGPGHVHDTVEDVRAVFEGTPEPLGACVDTGHFLRSSVTPAEAIPAIGNRVHALHLKDFDDEEREVVPGDGGLDVAQFLRLLERHTRFDQPLVIEYEADPDDPTPAVETTIDRVRTAEQELETE